MGEGGLGGRRVRMRGWILELEDVLHAATTDGDLLCHPPGQAWRDG